MIRQINHVWKLIPAASAGLAITAIVRLNPANIDLKNPDWRYTASFAQEHAFEYTVLATAVLVLVHWFKDDIHAGAAAIANAIAYALGVPPLSPVYKFSVETGKMLLQKFKRDVIESIRSDGRKEGREEGLHEGPRSRHQTPAPTAESSSRRSGNSTSLRGSDCHHAR